jgi:hypothetical protein
MVEDVTIPFTARGFRTATGFVVVFPVVVRELVLFAMYTSISGEGCTRPASMCVAAPPRQCQPSQG